MNGKARAATDPRPRPGAWPGLVSAPLGAAALDVLGLPAALEWHMRRIQRRTGLQYELTVSECPGFDLPEDCAATIFGLYADALSTAARRTGAGRVVIALTITPHEVTLVVRGNGVARGEVQGLGDASNTVRVRLPIARVP